MGLKKDFKIRNKDEMIVSNAYHSIEKTLDNINNNVIIYMQVHTSRDDKLANELPIPESKNSYTISKFNSDGSDNRDYADYFSEFALKDLEITFREAAYKYLKERVAYYSDAEDVFEE